MQVYCLEVIAVSQLLLAESMQIAIQVSDQVLINPRRILRFQYMIHNNAEEAPLRLHKWIYSLNSYLDGPNPAPSGMVTCQNPIKGQATCQLVSINNIIQYVRQALLLRINHCGIII